MSETLPPDALELLRRARRGAADIRALARAVASLPPMVLLLPADGVSSFLQGLERTPDGIPSGYGAVKWGDAPEPAPMGAAGPDGRLVPWVFTSEGAARAFALEKGLASADGETFTSTTAWPQGVYQALMRGWGGLVLDEGSDHALPLGRPTLARLLALLTLEGFASAPALQALMADGTVHVQTVGDRRTRLAFAFDGAASAEAGLPRVARGAALVCRPVPTLPLLKELLAAGVEHLIVNPSLGDERPYDADELAAMVRLLGDTPPPGPLRDATGASETPAVLRRALETATLPPVEPPGRHDSDSRAFAGALRRQVDARSIEPWQLVEAFSFEMDVHVPVHGRAVDGLTWPQMQRDPNDEAKVISSVFSQSAAARAALQDPEGRQLLTLSGVEAFRWIWSAPAEIHSIVLDVHDPQGWIKFPTWWGLMSVFPVSIEIPDLERVPAVGLERLGQLPGARGLKPEAVRALVLGSRSLTRSDGATPVTLGGRQYVPAASREQPVAADWRTGKVPPGPATSDPPFLDWLAAAAGCDGVALDPASKAPLLLDHTDLLVLDLWARTGRQPSPPDILAAASRSFGAGAIPLAVAARIAADMPRYWLGVIREADLVSMLVFPGTDACCLFSTQERARRYIGKLGGSGARAHPAPVPCKWQVNAFRTVLAGFEEAWLDPEDPLVGGGLRLSNEAVRAAAARLDDKLKPRVPGFIAARP
jgi:hypothetical protein